MRDFVLFIVVLGLLPFCFIRPYVGVLVYSWLSYMNPHRLTFGAAYDFPFAQAVALATLTGTMFLLLSGKEKLSIPWTRETVLLLLLTAMFTITSFFSLVPGVVWSQWQHIVKIMLITFLTLVLFKDEKRLRLLLLIIALSLGFYGFKGGLFAVLTGGNHRVYGPGGMIGDNTALGLALVMTLPIIYYLQKTETHKLLRLALLLTTLLTVLAIVFTYSRGAWLGLAGVFLLIFLDFPFRTKIVVSLLAIPLVASFVAFAPDRVFDRATTITEYEQDGSANARLTAWETAWLVARARPLTGGGFSVIDEPEIGKRFNPNFTPQDAGAHSIYFEVLAENGFITFFVFVFLLYGCIWRMFCLKRFARSRDSTNAYYYSQMIFVSLVGYAISGAFLEFAHFDLYYHLVACSIILTTLHRKRSEVSDPVKSQSSLLSKRIANSKR